MKQPSIYLKMRVLGAIDTVQGRTRHERVQNVAAMTFLDEEGHSRQFTWRTISTWFYRYKNYGITGMTVLSRALVVFWGEYCGIAIGMGVPLLHREFGKIGTPRRG